MSDTIAADVTPEGMSRRGFLLNAGRFGLTVAAAAIATPALLVLTEEDAEAASTPAQGFYKAYEGGFYYFGPTAPSQPTVGYRPGAGMPAWKRNRKYSFTVYPSPQNDGTKTMTGPYKLLA